MAPKPKAPAPALKRPAAAQVEDGTMEDAALLKARKVMLGWMKYTVRPSGKEEDKEAEKQESEVRARAAKAYAELDNSSKGSFIARWNNSTDKKKGQWLRDFNEGMDKTKNFHREKTTDMLTRLLQEVAPPCMQYLIQENPSPCNQRTLALVFQRG